MSDDDYPRKSPEPFWLTRLKYKVKRIFTNGDIAFGAMLGSIFTSCIWLGLQIYFEWSFT